jgi:hypothetical protein
MSLKHMDIAHKVAIRVLVLVVDMVRVLVVLVISVMVHLIAAQKVVVLNPNY